MTLMKIYEELFAKLEPPLPEAGVDSINPAVMAQISLAVSVKRIADILEGNPARFGLLDTLWEIADRSKHA